jgi:hypothetical protein
MKLTRLHLDPARTSLQGILLTLVLLALAAGCGDDDSDSARPRDDGRSSTTSTSSTTQPPASDEEAAFPIIEDLALEATALADQLFQHPDEVNNPDNQDIERLREIYTDDSPTPDGIIDQLHGLAEKGQHRRPAASGVFRDLGVYQFTRLDDDKVRFRVCASEDQETVDANDKVVDQRAQVVQGVGEARRVDGEWRFYGINLEEDRTLPIQPGTANPGFCDSLFAGEADP